MEFFIYSPPNFTNLNSYCGLRVGANNSKPERAHTMQPLNHRSYAQTCIITVHSLLGFNISELREPGA